MDSLEFQSLIGITAQYEALKAVNREIVNIA